MTVSNSTWFFFSAVSVNQGTMSILQYFEKSSLSCSNTVFLPDPRGSLSRSIPSSAIAAANSEIRCSMASQSHPRQANQYNVYTPKQRATIAVENVVVVAKR